MNMTIRSGSGKFTGLSRTVLMREKMAVLAPTPSAKARTAVRVNPGDCTNIRKECFRSCKKDSIVLVWLLLTLYGGPPERFPKKRVRATFFLAKDLHDASRAISVYLQPSPA